MAVTDIQKHMMRTFITLRIAVGCLGLALPFILVYGGEYKHVPFAGSMSSYYHANSGCWIPDNIPSQTTGNAPWPPPSTDPCSAQGTGPMRNWFVAIFCFIGVGMFAIKGFSVYEDWLLNIAAVAAPVVAFNPMAWPPDGKLSLHYASAIVFFICIGSTCIFRAHKTLKEMPQCPNRAKNHRYV